MEYEKPRIISKNEHRYTTCIHRKPCDRMAEIARMRIWYNSNTSVEDCVSCAYRCDCCNQYEGSKQ